MNTIVILAVLIVLALIASLAVRQERLTDRVDALERAAGMRAYVEENRPRPVRPAWRRPPTSAAVTEHSPVNA